MVGAGTPTHREVGTSMQVCATEPFQQVLVADDFGMSPALARHFLW